MAPRVGEVSLDIGDADNYVSIQVLALPRVRLSFWGAVYLIKSLPLLSDLHTRAPIRGEIPQGVADADLPEYVRSAYAPMGRRSRCWHIAYHSIYDNLEIALYAWDIYSGKALQQLSSAPYDGCAFPLVRVLTFNIRFVDDYLSEDQNINSPPGTEANILAFVQRVKEMAPRVHEIYQNVGDTDYGLLEDYGVHTTLLVSQLYGIAETTVISKRNRDLVVSPGLAPIGNLTSIVYDLDWLDYRVSALIRQSSQSLQTLHIRVNETSDISGLIRDPVDGSQYIEYPRLHTLNIHGSDAGQRRGFNDVVLFPGLQRLTLVSRYPFDDDVLFRGNGATLEYLKVVLYSETVGLLRKYNVFTPTSHPKLRACIYSVRHNEPIAFDTASDYMKFALSIAPAASVRVLPYLREFGEPLVPTLSLLGNHASIQVLSMADINMSFWDALTLIKSLPLLSDLYAGYPTLDEYPQGVTEAALPEYVISNYAPMGKRFRVIVFNDDFKNRSSALENAQPVYEIVSKWRTIEIQPSNAVSQQILLTGKYEGWTGHSVSLTGFGGITVAKRMGVLNCGWKFVDFTSNEFFWRISGWNSSWTLTDVAGKVVAKFTRAGFHMSKLGVLEVMEDVNEALLTLILLTCKLVHQSVQESERSSSGG
ncbi:hypothetical protein GGH94_004426 [Coemansia aciculifera]|uniref:Uncharacterized protein n=1 Tax=Coemansia aciculifera TaxID=417176 RepID=A0A9W8IFG4_9FUNG|nr:hypothetical protein GGH94_004426 [Coemansia aciculifera]